MFKSRFPRVFAIILALALALATPAPIHAQRGHVSVGVGWGWGYPGWGWGPGWGYGPYWGWGYGPYWGGPWGWGWPGYWGPGGYYYDTPYAEARIQIVPKQAEVFVDGYRAGIVDDFDGVLQRLNVWPGEHEVTLFLEGYRTEHHKLYFNDGTTANLKGTMEKLAAGEKSEPPPVPAPRDESQQQRGRRGGPPSQQQQQQGYPTPLPVPSPLPREATNTVSVQQEPVKYGGVSIRVQPADADVQIDEQSWTSSVGDSRLNVQLPVGRHHVAISKEGFAPYSEDILIRAGATLTLNVSLTKK